MFRPAQTEADKNFRVLRVTGYKLRVKIGISSNFTPYPETRNT